MDAELLRLAREAVTALQLQAHAKRNRRSVSNMLEVILEDTFGEALLRRAAGGR